MPPSSRRSALALALALVATAPALTAQEAAPVPPEIEGRRSGYLFLDPATRLLQDDDFLNPATFAIDRGRALWAQPGPEGVSCASCHGPAEEAMRGVAARYPVHDPAAGGLVNLEQRINAERATRMGAAPLAYESEDMLALSAYVALQSRGMPMAVDVSGPAAPFLEEGRAFFETRRGQLDLACTHCHDGLVGQRLRGDVISQGQINGFPIYRMMWSSMASRHRMFEWCNTALRAEPYPLGSPEYLALELYLAWRGRGLPVEAPAVRR